MYAFSATLGAILAMIAATTANGRDMCMGRGCDQGFPPTVLVQYDYSTGVQSAHAKQGRIFNKTPNSTTIVTRAKFKINPGYGPHTTCRLNFGGPNGTIRGEGEFDFYGYVKRPGKDDDSVVFAENIRERYFGRANTSNVPREFGYRPGFGEWFACGNQTVIAEFVGVGAVNITWDGNDKSAGPTMQWA